MHLQCCFVDRHNSFIDFYYEYFKVKEGTSRSRQPHGLRHWSAAARLLGLWIRIPPGAWMSVCVSVVCCQVEASALGWSLIQRSPTDCAASLCVIVNPRYWGGLGPLGGCCAMGERRMRRRRRRRRRRKRRRRKRMGRDANITTPT